MPQSDQRGATRRTRPDGRKVPEAMGIEAALLGACLADARACQVLVHELSPEDFYRPANSIIAAAIIELYSAGAAVDTLTVSNLIANGAGLSAIGGDETLVGYLFDYPSVKAAPTYARTIAETSARRRLLGVAAELTEAAYDTAQPLETVVSHGLTGLRALDLPTRPEGPDMVQTLLDGTEDYDWVVPKLLERGDRLMVTSSEGSGKSTLLAQLGVQFSAGIHPFRRERFAPVNVLVVDVENPVALVRRRMADLVGRLPSQRRQVRFGETDEPGFDLDRLRVRVRSEGIDLLTRNDRRWFTERIMANQPDVVITGPIYKLHRGDATDEAPARDIAAYFDDLRSTYGFSLVIEAHSPYGTEGGKHRILRPFGASLWSRWPEFGFGMRLAEEDRKDPRTLVDWVAWRGARDSGRDWPRQLVHGSTWPWENAALLEERF
jgi:AAA domain-containing protein/DnaB helicase-like protein